MLLDGRSGISLIAPSGHAHLLQRIRDADLVLSDSGGIQEEAPALGTPLLILRDKTERPEAIASGNALLVGTSAKAIVAQTRRLLGDPTARAAMSLRAFPFGDGRAAPRIAAVIAGWLEQRPDLDRLLLDGTG
jgi:UDP-N-acetylglucosamine 2-epimerase (non-hydrolysing)